MCSLRENIHDFTRTAIIYIGLLRESSEKNPYRNSDKILYLIFDYPHKHHSFKHFEV